MAVGEQVLHLHVRGKIQQTQPVPLPLSAPSERGWVATGPVWPPPLCAQQEEAVPWPHHRQSAHNSGVITHPVHTCHPCAGTTQQEACQQHTPVQAVMLAWTPHRRSLLLSWRADPAAPTHPLLPTQVLHPQLHKVLPQNGWHISWAITFHSQ